MNHPDDPKGAGGQAEGHATGETQEMKSHRAEKTEPDTAVMTEPGLATTTDQDPVTYEAGWDSTAGVQATLLTEIVYVWWLFIGGAFQILAGGMYLGSLQGAQIHLSTSWANLLYVVIGMAMVTMGFGILRLERWAYWAGWLLSLALLAVAVFEVVRWATGTPITLDTAFFAILDVLFALYNLYFLLQADTRKTAHFAPFKGGPVSPGMALCGIALATPSLAATLFVNHIDKHLSSPDLLLIYLLGAVLVIVMAFMALRLRRWVWWGDLGWAAVLTGVSIYFVAHQLTDVILAQHSSGSVDTQGMIFSGLNLVFVAMVVYFLFMHDVRGAVFGSRRKQAVFSPRTLIGGLSLGVLALVIYLLPGELGKVAITYTVFGLATGTIVGLVPGADPANRISAYFAGLLLAFASYVARGGLLPYTKGSAAVVVLLLLLVITGITAAVRSRAWFVLLLLGVGTMYGLVEPLFEAAPSAYLASAGVAFVGILLSFGVGYAVSSLLQLELVPYKSNPALASQASPGSSAASGEPAHDSARPTADAR